MLQPKRTKFRKQFKGRIHGTAKGGTNLDFGAFGLKALEPERVTARQIEAARRAITREMKRQGRVWIRIFPDVPVTSKPTEVRMGKGKGAVDYWACAREAGPHHVRDRRRARGNRPRGAAPGRGQALGQDALHPAHRRVREGPIMNASDVRAKTIDQLNDELASLKKEQFNLRFQKATGQLEKTHRSNEVRKDIARIKTIAAEKSAGKKA